MLNDNVPQILRWHSIWSSNQNNYIHPLSNIGNDHSLSKECLNCFLKNYPLLQHRR